MRNVLDLFSGAGGLSHGFKKAGFKIDAAVDFDLASVLTHKKNFKNTLSLQADLSKLGPEEFSNTHSFAKGDFEGIIGGPPCQGFSLAGPRKFFDSRNRLYLEFIDYVKFFRPNFFLVENVPGLAGLFVGQIKKKIISEFEKMGYKVDSKILLASDYGVPQDRRRIFFIGSLKSKIPFPAADHFNISREQQTMGNKSSKVTVREAISDLPLLMNCSGAEETDYIMPAQNRYQKEIRKNSDKIHNHVATAHHEKTKKIISMVPQGKNFKSLPKKFRNSRNYHVAWTRLHYDKPAPTIDTGHRHHFHPEANRVPTVRESARIQSFSDRFIFNGSRTSQYKQVGNAVPPILAYRIADQIKKAI